MKYLFEEVAYLKGLAEGMDISSESKEGKIIHKIIDVLDSFADAIVELDEEQADLTEYVESIDEDLCDIEDDIYSDSEIDEDEEGDLSFIEMECPNCKDLVEVDEELLYDDEVDIVCPNCQGIILSADDEDCMCIDCYDDIDEN
ncbi:CD1247 N-terminal domain-containing protein [Romboutsia sp. 1001216sp1]|uniref:CD1247 N-terminal domain-containing protein n=1 Tax=Romboutsia sp. 1001216sp1 TaxID=2986997 RepID=UPI00232F88DE|nr:CD1247 N-terminal domain-containing protein [Romboutsia sp. 1001216sp1]MDB8804485.1 zinc ribbon domain-containing protein [Romboutsia sp. 1001216sp1]MDB8806591.1 zinc ribbon domain-containing protein [Romboutsia sp. 1001216sp1]MDB8810133.1 zinc ribbon domain-containing protein [Romboutsia sp. 1001216sp1]MDB8815880.1 zinc ribbon domain-containing protein [Romboutsia sp. 1001216sp1]MDB8818330.1 zinc ribbon domain-containing protein [Romboutsia sp. 1001216sp1]